MRRHSIKFHLLSSCTPASALLLPHIPSLKVSLLALSFSVLSPRPNSAFCVPGKPRFVSSFSFLLSPLLFSSSQTIGSSCQAAGQRSPNMSSLRFIFFVALLAAVALAVPSPKIQKRSFKVPRQLNTAHPTGPNGPAALRKVFRKYNFQMREDFMVKDGFISFSKQSQDNVTTESAAAAAAPGGTNKTGTVAANPANNAALFLSPVDVGGQTLNLDFDSGSSDL